MREKKQPFDHVERGLERITFALQKENFETYVRIFLEVFQEFEIDILNFAKQKDVYTAEGYWLDRIGDAVGEPRKGREDEPYRIAILFRIAVNNSDGTPKVITRLVKQFTTADHIHLSERYPAFGHIYVGGGVNHTEELVKLLEEIKAAGTSWIIQSDKNQDSHTFVWEETKTFLDEFFVAENGIDFEVFEVTVGGASFEPFLLEVPVVGDDGYLERTVKDSNFFAWEFPDWFMVDQDGTGFEDFYLDVEGGEKLVFPELVGGTVGGSSFVWEVQEGSKE